MSVLRSGSPHRPARSLATVAGILLTLVSLLLGLPGTAGAAAVKRAPEPTHPGQDWAGSQIARHEGTAAGGAPPAASLASVEGVDVSSHNGNVAWSTLWNSGVRFAYVKATESTSYTNPYFAQQYNGSYNAGMIRGAYHFATPNTSSGAAQAKYFADHGGGWSKDGKTLPGALDMEYNPYGATCYGLSAAGLVNWMKDWFATYKARTGRDAVLYTSTSWWKQCTGNSAAFGAVNPLWIPRYGSSAGELPAGWGFHTVWQYTSTGPTVGDHNRFNGSMDRLRALANG
ncbi:MULTISPECIES: lysozyme [unclassified Streptomyces]|uniref:lysozyme n=1 Tax=Streptomyces TaxID=1883 RepID=UPI000823D8F0|nr:MULTISPECIES: lysozyme [unclassified Streptomyces]AWN29506.1 lysozyme [Streptomyces sp. NEAU-S7GS2]MYT16241.1 lysozyme [Streptomyces sp. SID4951]SCK31333.1 Lyzozyme M1 (1,4-beta-N-acetylmuramidase), GH25 family [Streptomyces sp. SceaMP-e96]